MCRIIEGVRREAVDLWAPRQSLTGEERSDGTTEPRGVVGFEVILGAYVSLLSMAATGSLSLVS